MTVTTREPLTVDTVLAPIDGSEESTTAVEYAIAIADRYDASIHVLYVLGYGVIEGLDAGTVASNEVADHTKAVLDGVERHAADHGVSVTSSIAHGFSTSLKTRHPGSVVLDAAASIGVDFVVLPRVSTTDATADVLERTAEYVLAYASEPVLSV